MVTSFAEALRQAPQGKRHLLLGNGFSIACRPDIFVYRKLLEQADFTTLAPSARRAFDALATNDFEKVIRTLRDAYAVASAYDGVPNAFLVALQEDTSGLRDLLVRTIASSHPEWPGEIEDQKYVFCRQFLANFETVYSLNYDLLLYWAQMHTPEGVAPTADDGFRKPERDEEDGEAGYVSWNPHQSHRQNTWFLHGALHIFDSEIEVKKFTWINTGVRLIEQIRDALQRGMFPLFVAEGTSREKLERIRHSDYLSKAYRSFSEIRGSLFVYGHSLSENDEHYLRRIEKGKIGHIFVGLYGDPDSEPNQLIRRRANRMAQVRTRPELRVSFFDAASAQVWG